MVVVAGLVLLLEQVALVAAVTAVITQTAILEQPIPAEVAVVVVVLTPVLAEQVALVSC